MDTVNKEWNVKVDFITFYKFSVTENNYADNVRKTYEILSPNDIPKLYIDASAYTVEDIKEKIAYSRKIAEDAGISTDDMDILENSVDDRFVEAMKDFYEKNIKTYIDKLGNVTYINISGEHSIFKHKPSEVTNAIRSFLDKLN